MSRSTSNDFGRTSLRNAFRLVMERRDRYESPIEGESSSPTALGTAVRFYIDQVRFGAAPTYGNDSGEAVLNVYTSSGAHKKASALERGIRLALGVGPVGVAAAAAIGGLIAAVTSPVALTGLIIAACLAPVLAKDALKSARQLMHAFRIWDDRTSALRQAAAKQMEVVEAEAQAVSKSVWHARDASLASPAELEPTIKSLAADANRLNAGVIFHTESEDAARMLSSKFGFELKFSAVDPFAATKKDHVLYRAPIAVTESATARTKERVRLPLGTELAGGMVQSTALSTPPAARSMSVEL